jgi:16S rRNA (cytidine1402-2'-O)-methyltransferase
LQIVAFDGDNIKPTGGCFCDFQQTVPRSKNDAPLLGEGDASQRPAMLAQSALPHLHKDPSSVLVAHDQINFTPAPPRRPIIALQQLQALGLQVTQGAVFGRISFLLGGEKRLRLTAGFAHSFSSMNASFDSALLAANAACANQSHPPGTLYVVGTPIGNLADISLRALHVLHLCDTLACEDTRHSQTLLRAYGIDKSASHWLAVHQHNEAEAAEEVIRRLQAGQRVAYVSDAGTPAVSDPGARLAWQVQRAGLRVCPLPGASSVTALLSACGTPTHDATGFVFVGFLPAKATERMQAVALLGQEPRTQVLLEAPHRIEALASALAALDDRPITVGRELTKQFEEVATVAARELSAWLQAEPQRTRGEFALVVHAQVQARPSGTDHDRLLKILMQELPLKSAVKVAAELSGEGKNALYERALVLKAASSE